MRSRSEDSLTPTTLLPYFSLFSIHKHLLKAVYKLQDLVQLISDIQLLLGSMQESSKKNAEMEKVAKKLKKFLASTRICCNTMYPATQLYNLMYSYLFQTLSMEKVGKQLKQRLSAVLSMCKIVESVIKTRFVDLEKSFKGFLYMAHRILQKVMIRMYPFVYEVFEEEWRCRFAKANY